MPYFYDHQERFKILLVHHEKLVGNLPQVPNLREVLATQNDLRSNKDYGSLRLTVDTAEDLELLRQIYSRFPGRDDFSWLEVAALLEREPALLAINAQVQHKHYRQVDERRADPG
jgi:spore coat polysaccharide biosynthesis protein SpsF (cytidylyltransferase family)